MGVSSCISILFIVSVPVLSEQRMDIPAMSSMAAKRATKVEKKEKKSYETEG